jgi:hypothetical protein
MNTDGMKALVSWCKRWRPKQEVPSDEPTEGERVPHTPIQRRVQNLEPVREGGVIYGKLANTLECYHGAYAEDVNDEDRQHPKQPIQPAPRVAGCLSGLFGGGLVLERGRWTHGARLGRPVISFKESFSR